MALTPQQLKAIQDAREGLGLTPEVPANVQSQRLIQERINDFNVGLQQFKDQRLADTEQESAESAMAVFPAKTGESPIKAGLKAAGNLPSSAFNLGKSLYDLVRHPIQTAGNLKDVGTAGIDELVERAGGDLTDDPEIEGMKSALKSELVKRYGSLDALQRTATNDPFAFGADIVGLLSGATIARKIPKVAQLADKVVEPLSDLRTAARTAVGDTIAASAEKSVSKALNPTKENMKVMTQQIAPELAKRKKVAFTSSGLEQKFADEAYVAGEAIDEAWAQLPADAVEDVRPIVQAIEDSKNNFIVEDTIIEPNAWKAADDLQKIILEASKGEDYIPSQSLRRIRQIWDEFIDKSRGFTRDLSDQDKLAIKREATDAIRKVLSEAHPDIAALNKEYTLWRKAEQVMSETNKRNTARGAGNLRTDVSAVGGGAVGSVTDGLKGAALGAGIVAAIALAMRTTAWHTLSAAAKSKIAEAIYTGKPAVVKRTLIPILMEQGIDISNELGGLEEEVEEIE